MGQKCLLLGDDIKEHTFCKDIIDKTIQAYGQLNIVVNNANL